MEQTLRAEMVASVHSVVAQVGDEALPRIAAESGWVWRARRSRCMAGGRRGRQDRVNMGRERFAEKRSKFAWLGLVW